MGHTSSNKPIANAKITVRKVKEGHYEASFEGAPIGHNFAANTQEEVIAKMKDWFAMQGEKSRRIVIEEAEGADKFEQCVRDIQDAIDNNRIETDELI
jgi:hypothetical protein